MFDKKWKKKKSFYILCEFNNYNFEYINEIYKNLIKVYKFWSLNFILKFSWKYFYLLIKNIMNQTK